MFTLMTTYRNELQELIGYDQISTDSDDKRCEILCLNMYY